jgi:hypothetical protein
MSSSAHCKSGLLVWRLGGFKPLYSSLWQVKLAYNIRRILGFAASLALWVPGDTSVMSEASKSRYHCFCQFLGTTFGHVPWAFETRVEAFLWSLTRSCNSIFVIIYKVVTL